MNALTRIAIAALVLALAACSKVTPENYSKIQAGMTRDEVYAILGKPTEVSGAGLGGLTLSNETWKGSKHTISITFGNGKVTLRSISAADGQPQKSQ